MTFLLLPLIAAATFLENGPFVVEADKAISRSGELELSGHVKIHTGVLSAESDEARCSHDQQGPMSLRHHVFLCAQDYGQISCDEAILDPTAKKAFFQSKTGPVIFQDEKNGVIVESSLMTLLFTESSIEQFQAEKNVCASWKYGLSCFAEEAIFVPSQNELSFNKAHIIAKERADLYTKKALLKTKGHAIHLEEVNGYFKAKDDLHIIADTLSYQEPLICLQGHVTLQVKLLSGPATLSHIENCTIDDAKGSIHIVPATGQRLLLEAPYGTMRANNIEIIYDKDDDEYRPKFFLLKGNVEMANTYSFRDPETPVNRFALADIVEVDCYDRVMTLKARENKRVLFFDEEKKVQVSAEAIAVCYKNGQEEISGKGAVRMLFTDSELLRMTDRFHK